MTRQMEMIVFYRDFLDADIKQGSIAELSVISLLYGYNIEFKFYFAVLHRLKFCKLFYFFHAEV